MFAFGGVEPDYCAGMVVGLFIGRCVEREFCGCVLVGRLDAVVGECRRVGEWFVELDDEVVPKVVGHSAAVACGVSHYLVFFGDYRY